MSSESPLEQNSPDKDKGTTARFAIYMVISAVSNLGYAMICKEILGLDEKIAYAISLILVSLQNFFFLMYFVYRTSHGEKLNQFIKYLHSIIGFRTWETLLFLILEDALGIDYRIAILIVLGQSVILKATLYKKLVFRVSETDPESMVG